MDSRVRDREPAGMDTALLAYSGISVKMMVDRGLGAELLVMFMVDYEPGGAAQAHDHPFEEAYFFLEGQIDAELDGIAYRLGAGDVLFAGVVTSICGPLCVRPLSDSVAAVPAPLTIVAPLAFTAVAVSEATSLSEAPTV